MCEDGEGRKGKDMTRKEDKRSKREDGGKKLRKGGIRERLIDLPVGIPLPVK